MEKILVTGGAGFIGSHTCVSLLEYGYNIIILDNFVNSNPIVLERIKEITNKDFIFYNTDVLNYDGLCRIFSENKIDAIIHFAGLKAVGESVKKPLEYYHNNITGTINLLRAAQKYNCKKFVFSSSATVYGINNPVPYEETYPTSSVNPYGNTKVITEQILTDMYNSDNDWSISLLRYFNPIGAHKSGLIGEEPSGIPNNLFPYILQVACGKLDMLSIFGNDYNTPDGTCIRDYIHVSDIADGHISALDYILSRKGIEAINLGTGKGTSVLEIVNTFEHVYGKKLPIITTTRRPGDIAECYADISKAKRLLNWEAKLSLEEMCRDGLNFAIKNIK